MPTTEAPTTAVPTPELRITAPASPPQHLEGSWVRILAMLAISLVVFDSVATYTHLLHGYAIEQNALVAAMIDRWGPDLGLTLRTIQVSALVAGLAWLAHRSRLARHGLVGVTAVMVGVAVYHVAGAAAFGV